MDRDVDDCGSYCVWNTFEMCPAAIGLKRVTLAL
jgi:hypothetical protein